MSASARRWRRRGRPENSQLMATCGTVLPVSSGVCRRLMSVPGVGALVAITFTSAVDEPGRFARSRAVGAHFGLTPKKYQSGETDVTGGRNKGGAAAGR